MRDPQMDALARSALQSDQSTLIVTNRPKLNPATASLDQLSESEYQQQIQYLLSSSKSPDRTRYDYSADGDKKLTDILRTELYSYAFSNLPHRLINLQKRGFELQDRSSVAKFLTSPKKLADAVNRIKTMEYEAFRHPGRKMSYLAREQLRDEAIAGWIKDATRFTILSHTWEQRGELSYQDFMGQKDLPDLHLCQQDSDQIRSLKKLHNFCHISKEFAEFAWADNVCIDKSTIPELDEAIRSMFSWYRSAIICIIYLAETSTLLDLIRGYDRWFTRGWTLQELLAPQRLKFYNKDWYRLTDLLNDKISKEDDREIRLLHDKSLSRQLDLLAGTILKQTGISMEQIRSFIPGIHHPSLPERMRWAARRSTTKEEDQSYSLMGIFNVSFPTAYGEGRERAFFRLFQAILEVGYQRDWFIWAGQPISPSIHPSRMVPSSPNCYAHLGPHPPKGGIEALDEPVGLTNLGLRMTILFVPADVKELGELTRFSDDIPPHITVACPSISNKIVEMRGIKHLHDPDAKHPTEEEFALGILNVNPEKDSARYPDRLYAILLRRAVTRKSGLSTHGNWKKCSTDEVITFEHYDKSKISKAEVEGMVAWPATYIKRREEWVETKMGFRTMYL